MGHPEPWPGDRDEVLDRVGETDDPLDRPVHLVPQPNSAVFAPGGHRLVDKGNGGHGRTRAAQPTRVFTGREVPHSDRAVLSARDGDPAVVGHGDGADRPMVALKNLFAPALVEVPQPHCAIGAAGDDAVRTRDPRERADKRLVSLQRENALARLDVPQPETAVRTAGRRRPPVTGHGNTDRDTRVRAEIAQPFAVGCVEKGQGSVFQARDQDAAPQGRCHRTALPRRSTQGKSAARSPVTAAQDDRSRLGRANRDLAARQGHQAVYRCGDLNHLLDAKTGEVKS